MRAVFLETSTNEVRKYGETLGGLGHEILPVRYDIQGLSDEVLYRQVKENRPDIIVYIGQRWGKTPAAATLATITNRLAPTVHICSDAADPPWHDMLREYHSAGAFSLQVAIDGSHKWPTSEVGLTALTPVDQKVFDASLPHSARNIICGYAGNPGAGIGRRTAMLSDLLSRRVIDQLHIRSNLPFTNEMYNRFLGNCRISVNIAYSGTEAALHVKGRVLESALAGALLLETRGSPSSYWFRPGIDYLEYETAEEAEQIVTRLRQDPDATQAMAQSLMKRVREEHSPAMFWQRIFERIGLNVAV